MIAKNEAMALARRLMTLPASKESFGGATAEEIRAELVRALERAQSQPAALRAVESLMRGEWRPTPGQVFDAVASAAEDQPERRRCQCCDGFGAVLVYILIRYDSHGRRRRGRSLPQIQSEEQAQQFRRTMQPDEDLVSAARACPACQSLQREAA